MIIHLREDVRKEKVAEISSALDAISFHDGRRFIVVTPSKIRQMPKEFDTFIDRSFPFDTDIQLASRNYRNETRSITIDGMEIGGSSNHTLIITGPCSVESEEQIEKCAAFVKSLGIKVFRAGCFKPRTSPYSFQGLGLEGMKLLENIRQQHGLKIISEIRDATHADEVIESVDVIQIGAKAMYDHGILRKCGTSKKPVLLKRGFGTTLQEFVQAAEFILSLGNGRVMLCERGIRTFETMTRFTLDLCGVAWLKENTNLPIFVDPSHAIGFSYGVPDLARASMAMGVDGLLMESHPDPPSALSDASQQLNFEEFKKLFQTLPQIASAVGRKII